MKHLYILLSILGIQLIVLNSCENATSSKINQDSFDEAMTSINDMPYQEVSLAEQKGLEFMREEEKLARDVYIVLYTKWGLKVFNNISQSEQKHTDAIKMLLDKYQLADPVGNNSIGVFQDTFLQGLFNNLTSYADSSLVHALTVGAIIEEVDIRDIQNELDSNVDNDDIGYVYENLLNGSKNHLRAYVKNLSSNGVTYIPQYINEVEYFKIISSGQ